MDRGQEAAPTIGLTSAHKLSMWEGHLAPIHFYWPQHTRKSVYVDWKDTKENVRCGKRFRKIGSFSDVCNSYYFPKGNSMRV